MEALSKLCLIPKFIILMTCFLFLSWKPDYKWLRNGEEADMILRTGLVDMEGKRWDGSFWSAGERKISPLG